MPTIKFSLKDLQNLVGKKLEIDEVSKLVEYGKGELEGYDKDSDEVSVEFGDTNLPYLWSIEGFARLVNGVLGGCKGIPKIEIKKSDYKLIVDESVKYVRPYIAAFVAKGHKVDDYLIKQMIQLQEKLCESYGRRRLKVAIGVYSYDKIKFPVHYKATSPESVKFIPLEFKKEMTQQEILEEHPTGKEYAWILKDAKKYPILVDSADSVLSFPPIINSNLTGRVVSGEEHLFVECTGIELEPLLLAMNIMAYAFYDRGFEIYSVDVKYENKKITTPLLFNDKIKITLEQVKSLLGLELKNSEIKMLLEKMGYDVGSDLNVKIPSYRKDILHPNDVIEDIGIAYGYDKFDEIPLTSYTVGETSLLVKFRNNIREMLIGLGFQEVLSPILSNKAVLYDKMNIPDFGTIELTNFMSETYSCVRSWLLPMLIDFLSKNKHFEYPQRVFEQGLVTVHKGDSVVDYERIAVVSANDKADYTEIRQVIDYLFRMLDVSYSVEDCEHDSFIPGRVGRVIVNGKKVAYIGEISPKVLNNNGIEVPVVGLELNISELFEIVGKN
ncbi:MAG: phenylalanine--tRNA ligase subunit beta [Nanoarchaeota archaeon]|nr:phenylalanine--tRNA ligase subunit beta [Nanoarchaeota archaeon]MBU1004345.1 phenylalanine--tRNA ligase subunit beta [Nanoarchaeota archaeon]MBU1946304.1 phenylalanine--tRNA ligase subunit beta [Nanoarchaeota archaeon]